MSADGCKMVAAISQGGIWTWQTTPAPVLTVTPSGGNLLLSWIVPSQNLILQETGDLTSTNWSDVPSTPTLNYTNLNYQVTIPAAGGARFYRLQLR
jgi:hypothetical protein